MNRICSKCGQEKPLTKFKKDKTRSLGYRQTCLTCTNAYHAQRRANGHKSIVGRGQTPSDDGFATVPTHRTCAKCHCEKPLAEFEKNKRNVCGYGTRCRECVRAYMAQWKAQNRDHLNAYYRAYFKGNTRHAEHTRSWYLNNKERVRECGRMRYATNPEAAREKNRKLREKYPEREREKAKRSRQKHPLTKRSSEARRRARKNASSSHYTVKDVLALLEQQANKCHWCSQPLDIYHVDHVIPLSRGGDNSVANIVISCPRCNLRKKDKMPEEWLAILEREKNQASGAIEAAN